MRDDFECQAYVAHLRSEHARVHEAVQAVERDLSTSARTRDPQQVVRELQKLRAVLEQHFAAEESGGCLEEAACQCPRLSATIAAIEREHPMLLRMLDRLIERAATNEVGCNTQDFVEAFHRLVKTLRAHEAAENRVLEEAFGTGEFEAEPANYRPRGC